MDSCELTNKTSQRILKKQYDLRVFILIGLIKLQSYELVSNKTVSNRPMNVEFCSKEDCLISISFHWSINTNLALVKKREIHVF